MGTEDKLNNNVRKQAYPMNKNITLKRDQEINNPCYKVFGLFTFIRYYL